jgi:hypothetical protein
MRGRPIRVKKGARAASGRTSIEGKSYGFRRAFSSTLSSICCLVSEMPAGVSTMGLGSFCDFLILFWMGLWFCMAGGFSQNLVRVFRS